VTRRFDLPVVGPATPVRFPPIGTAELDSGVRVWTIARASAPVVAAVLVVDRGSAFDPIDRPGLAGLTADLMDEGAGDRDAIELADAFARMGTYLEIEVGPDVTTFGLTTPARHFPDSLSLLADVVIRPRLEESDFQRVRELRLNRLRQLSRSPSSAADRAFLEAVFSTHPYGHGTLGTTPSLEAITAAHAREFWQNGMTPARSTLVLCGQIEHGAAVAAADAIFGAWDAPGDRVGAPPVSGAHADRRVLFVDRPGASQSELRVGHGGPPRKAPHYHALVTLNAILGGQFASRINRNLREVRGVTYGARTAFEYRRAGGSFSCETSVQSDATTESVSEILREFEGVRQEGALLPVELERARSSLTRGYVRNFETAMQLAGAAAQLVTHEIGPDSYDEFVPEVAAVTEADVIAAARAYVRPDDCAIVVVGDADRCLPSLESLGRPVVTVAPEF
jgi:zinc protease